MSELESLQQQLAALEAVAARSRIVRQTLESRGLWLPESAVAELVAIESAAELLDKIDVAADWCEMTRQLGLIHGAELSDAQVMRLYDATDDERSAFFKAEGERQRKARNPLGVLLSGTDHQRHQVFAATPWTWTVTT